VSRRDFSERVICRIDRDRRSDADKAQEARVTAEGRLATVAMILRLPDHQRLPFMDGILHGVRDQMTVCLDSAGASSRMAAAAQQAIIAGPNARARAEQVFAAHGPKLAGAVLAMEFRNLADDLDSTK
jgi:hypothetical protein